MVKINNNGGCFFANFVVFIKILLINLNEEYLIKEFLENRINTNFLHLVMTEHPYLVYSFFESH